ncbi:phosphatidylinositol phosphate synthase [Sanguibacter suaedae]|uniref:Phosphatidylinositol phosphate synthase n=1 Tax=Sanguibacter suaedae TaxID=2795737 RepID=A0A934ICL3_9MICO|nr:CDP-alcohol phosphatidyltransferase family protein [Sanguibacter suaedae]MBI9115305.1 CDP-alcohol phosphatidyltransferase family protein [Sanguibacter suaedae]
MLSRLRGAMAALLTPLARVLLRIGVTPDAVTVLGTVGVVAVALWAFPTDRLTLGAVVIGLFAVLDSLDGTMARLSGRSGPWGAFLDSTLDRAADAGIFCGLLAFFLLHTDGTLRTWGMVSALCCLVLGNLVSYARARAEGLDMTASVGIAERAERLVVSLLAAGLVGLGLPVVVLVVALAVLAAASGVTVVQRMATVRTQALATRTTPGAAPSPGG